MADLRKIQSELRKSYGVTAVSAGKQSEWFSTGEPELDSLMGGGIPRGRMIELYGKESTGKSTIVEVWASKYIAAGEHVVWIDYENSYTQDYANDLGLKDPEDGRLSILNPKSLEEGADMMLYYMNRIPKGLYVFDSLAAGTPKAQQVDDLSSEKKQAAGMFSRAASEIFRRSCDVIAMSGSTLVVINQVRTSLTGWRAGETTPGGNALRFYASHRLRLARRKTFVRKTKAAGEMKINETELLVVKTKLSKTEGQKLMLWIIPGRGYTVKPQAIVEDDAEVMPDEEEFEITPD